MGSTCSVAPRRFAPAAKQLCPGDVREVADSSGAAPRQATARPRSVRNRRQAQRARECAKPPAVIGPTAKQSPGCTRRRSLRRLLLAMIALLYVVSVPWYRATGAEWELIAGLPDWVAVALGCYVAVAILNAIAWLLTDVPDPDPDDDLEIGNSGGADRGASSGGSQ